MSNRIIPVSYDTRSVTGVAGGSVKVGELVTLVDGEVISATAGKEIVGFANNSALDTEVVSYTVANEGVEVEMDIAGGTITSADVGKFFALTDGNTVNGTTESAIKAAGSNVRLVKFISDTRGVFETVVGVHAMA